nr:hypothetical protein [Tanacetum cinerariifolium]
YPCEVESSNKIVGFCQLGFGQDHMGRSVCGHWYYSCMLQEHRKAGEYVLDRWSKSGENIWVDTSIDACESAIVHAIQQIFKDTVYRLVPFKHKLDLYQLELSDLLVKAEADIPVLMRVNKKDTFCSMLGVTEADRIVIKVPRHSKKQKAEGYNSITCPHKDEINAANKRAKRVTRSSSVNYKK